MTSEKSATGFNLVELGCAPGARSGAGCTTPRRNNCGSFSAIAAATVAISAINRKKAAPLIGGRRQVRQQTLSKRTRERELEMAVTKKRLRAKRARARQAERRTDLRSRYRHGDLPPAPDIAVIEYDDPYSPPGWINPEGTLDPNARLLQARRGDGSVAPGEPEWTAPPRPRVRAIVRLKEDPLGKLNARRQIDRPQFLGGREYQALFDKTQIGLVRSVDLSKTKVSGTQRFDPLTDERQRAGRKLHHADDAVMTRHGTEGLSLVRDVLCERRSVEHAGRLRGAQSDRDARWFGVLFRKCLTVLAVQFGFANTTRPPSRPAINGGDGIPDISDPSMNAAGAELADPRLRRGLPNGHGK
jgi:hypothetical protein